MQIPALFTKPIKHAKPFLERLLLLSNRCLLEHLQRMTGRLTVTVLGLDPTRHDLQHTIHKQSKNEQLHEKIKPPFKLAQGKYHLAPSYCFSSAEAKPL
jgi:hypothetical protein